MGMWAEDRFKLYGSFLDQSIGIDETNTFQQKKSIKTVGATVYKNNIWTFRRIFFYYYYFYKQNWYIFIYSAKILHESHMYLLRLLLLGILRIGELYSKYIYIYIYSSKNNIVKMGNKTLWCLYLLNKNF